MKTGLTCLAVTAPGLESLARAELAALGLAPGAAEPGGVPFACDGAGLRRANLWCRTVSRILVRLGEFRARTWFELERHCTRIDWPRLGGRPLDLRVTSRKSRLYHQRGIAERVARFAGLSEAGAGEEASRVVVRVVRDMVTVSADSSGANLHRRGWRLATAKAPLRETLAAAMLQATGWQDDEALVDPCCGAGTIAIEAALLATGTAPGLGRRFAFEGWTDHDPAAWAAERAAAASARRTSTATIRASDRDAGAVEATLANAERAGVAALVRCEHAALSAAPAFREVDGPALLLTNPPYGVRVGERGPLRDLHARLGALVRTRPTWRAAWLGASPELAAATGLPTERLLATSNGGIDVELLATPSPRLPHTGALGAE